MELIFGRLSDDENIESLYMTGKDIRNRMNMMNINKLMIENLKTGLGYFVDYNDENIYSELIDPYYSTVPNIIFSYISLEDDIKNNPEKYNENNYKHTDKFDEQSPSDYEMNQIKNNAILYGITGLVKKIINQKIYDKDYGFTDMAASGDNLNTLKYLIRKGFIVSIDTLNNAADGGYLEIVKYLMYNLSIKPTTDTIKSIVGRNQQSTGNPEKGKLEVLKYFEAMFDDMRVNSGRLIDYMIEDNYDYLIEKSLRYDYMEIFKHLIDNEEQVNDYIIKLIILYGNVDALKIIVSKHKNVKKSITKDYFVDAAKNYNLEMVKYLISLNIPPPNKGFIDRLNEHPPTHAEMKKLLLEYFDRQQ